jgi:hypothetical protein
MLATALPAAASWRQSTNVGTAGYVTNVDWRGVEGGVCGAPGQVPACNSYYGQIDYYDQIFVDKYAAYSAPYNVAQTVSSTAYLYWYDSVSGSWKYYLPKDEGYCANVAGNGASYCTFGSSAPDVGQSPWTPAFYNLPRGYSWTVVIRVSWWQQSTGKLLAQADYRPGGALSDIGCADYALRTYRCSGPRVDPASGLGYITMG